MRLIDTVDSIGKRAQTYEDLLRGVQALFAQNKVEEADFSAYVKALDIHRHYAGIHSINFALYLADSEKAKHENWMREHGHAHYQVAPLTKNSHYAPLIYIEPIERRDPILYGLDTLLLPAIAQAREQARDTGEPSISGKIALREQKDLEKIGFLLNFPVYKNHAAVTDIRSRRENLYGWVEASFRMDQFMTSILGEVNQEIAVEIYDGINANPSSLMYNSAPQLLRQSFQPQFRKEQRMQICGQPWTVIVSSLPNFEAQLNTQGANFALQSGISISFLLLLTTWLLVRGQARARDSANKLAQELRAREVVEAGMQASEKRLQEILDMLPIALFIKDPQSRHLLINRASEVQFGKPAQELLGTDASQCFPAEQMQDFLRKDQQAFQARKLVEFDEIAWNVGLQENRFVHTYKKPVFDEKGEPLYLICMTVDTTERSRTEEWLKLLETCVARLNDVVFITEPAPHPGAWPTIIFVNDAFEKQTGFSRAEAIGHTSEILRGPDTSWEELKRIGRAVAAWQPIRSELLNYHKNGQEFWMELELVPIANAQGKYIYWVTVGRNISERKHAEHALRASEAMHRAIIDHAPLPMLVSDMESDQIVYGNRRCTQMFAAQQELLTTTTACHFFADHLQRRALAEQVRNSHFVNDLEVMLKTADGQVFWAMVSMVRSRYEGRDSIISSMVDISAIKNIQEQLHDAREKADSANLAKSSFLSNMSHEIRTPMNSILGMTYLALATTLDVKQRDYLEKINLSGQHLLALIDDILDFSKIEAGMFTIENIPFNLSDVINKVRDLMAERIRDKGLQFKIVMGDGLDRSYVGDALRLSQVLINLTGNALKFTQQGEITLTLKVQMQHEQQSTLCFSVQDSGIGMSEQQLNNLFIPFQQADLSSSRKYGGTGLGLAISRQLVELMGGEIGVTSQLGQGSTFWFKLPLTHYAHEATVNPIAPSMPVAELMAQARANLAGSVILLAEDSPINQQVAMELLQSVGVQVEIANDGKEALQWLEKREFDCVLMDVQMPGMDGLEATRAIRSNPQLQDTIVIAMTANASTQDRGLCMAAGMQDFISKPIKPALLYASLAKWIQVPSTRAAQSLPSELEAIDLTPLTDLIGDDPQLIKKFVNMFFDSADSQMEQIELALFANNQSELSRLLHGLRGEACAMGVQELGALCRQMEKSLDEQAQALRLFASMQAMLEQVKLKMRAQLASDETTLPM